MSDNIIRQDVVDELVYEPRVNAAHIGVAVDNGVVTLSGHVESYAAKLAAERAARRVQGVKAIAEEITVRYPEDKKTADHEIAQRAASILAWSAVVPLGTVQVKVQRGWVELSGEVIWHYQKSAAEDEIRRLSGVTGILNHITIKPRISAGDVAQKINDTLRRCANAAGHRVRVSAEDGCVTLEGHVHSLQERRAAEAAAWLAPGVVNVIDRLVIG